jgi:hypothetical protein
VFQAQNLPFFNSDHGRLKIAFPTLAIHEDVTRRTATLLQLPEKGILSAIN